MHSRPPRLKGFRSLALVSLVGLASVALLAQAASAPNPYKWDESWKPQLPDGREWGSSAGVGVDRQGNIYVAERCGGNPLGCDGKTFGPIVKIAPSGKVLATFGGGLFVQPHGLYVDHDGNIWATDVNAKGGIGHQVFKFSPDGKVLLRLGKAGVKGDGPDTFNQPSAVVVAPNGDIFVADGHIGEDSNERVVKFNKDGKFIKTWGKRGTGPGEFDGPHAIAMDSRGRVLVADRSNNRIQIFDQDGKFLDQWKQFSRPSGIFINSSDTIFVIDSETKQVPGYGYNPGGSRGIRIGSAKDGSVTAFIPDPEPDPDHAGSTGGEGIAEFNGIIYAFGDHRQKMVAQRRYVKK
jgi:DNA-binding beta-propeller fold protein YncE